MMNRRSLFRSLDEKLVDACGPARKIADQPAIRPLIDTLYPTEPSAENWRVQSLRQRIGRLLDLRGRRRLVSIPIPQQLELGLEFGSDEEPETMSVPVNEYRRGEDAAKDTTLKRLVLLEARKKTLGIIRRLPVLSDTEQDNLLKAVGDAFDTVLGKAA